MRSPLFQRSKGLLVLLCIACQACYHRYPLAADQLKQLDGYSPARSFAGPLQSVDEGGGPRLRASLLPPGVLRIKDARGEWFDFDSETRLRLEGEGGDLAAGTLLSARVEQGVLHGQLSEGVPVHLRLGDLRDAEAARYSPGRTALAVTLGVVGTVLLLGFIWAHEMAATCAPSTGHGWC